MSVKQNFKEMQLTTYRMIQEGRYADDITEYLQVKYRINRDQAFSLYMNVQSMMPPEVGIDEF
jgi:hypothetical protein